MQKMTVTQARMKFMSLPRTLRGKDSVEVTSNGKPVLAVIPWELYESILETLEILGDEKLAKAVRQGIQDYKKGKTVPYR